jgi:hypothetical protein
VSSLESNNRATIAQLTVGDLSATEVAMLEAAGISATRGVRLGREILPFVEGVLEKANILWLAQGSSWFLGPVTDNGSVAHPVLSERNATVGSSGVVTTNEGYPSWYRRAASFGPGTWTGYPTGAPDTGNMVVMLYKIVNVNVTTTFSADGWTSIGPSLNTVQWYTNGGVSVNGTLIPGGYVEGAWNTLAMGWYGVDPDTTIEHWASHNGVVFSGSLDGASPGFVGGAALEAVGGSGDCRLTIAAFGRYPGGADGSLIRAALLSRWSIAIAGAL